MTQERHDGMTEGTNSPQTLTPGALRLKVTLPAAVLVQTFSPAAAKHTNTGPDTLTVSTSDRMTVKAEFPDGTVRTDQTEDFSLTFPVTFAPGPGPGHLRCLLGGGLFNIELSDAPPEEWQGIADALVERNAAQGLAVPDHVADTPPTLVQPDAFQTDAFAIASGYMRPIFGLSERKKDFPLLQEFHAPQTPLNWAVGMALFSLTDADRVRHGDWQEVTVADLEDRVFCLAERDAFRRGDHRTDILAEVVKLHTVRNWYYEIESVQIGRAWKTRATIGSRYAIPELELVFVDRQSGTRAFPSDAALRAFRVALQVKGRRAVKPDGSSIPALPSDRWALDAIRWRWVQSFNDDLLLTPDLVDAGRRQGLPKRTTKGRAIRKGYLIKVASNIFTALQRLRAEGSGSVYAHRLLIMLASNLNRTETGIAADRLYRMLGIGPDYAEVMHRDPADVVAAAIVRLMQPDIRALLPRSDTTPRTDPNPARRKAPYYRLLRSPDFQPRAGITSKEDAETIEAAYAVADHVEPELDQAVLPGLDVPPTLPIPSGSDIRAARQAAGLTLRTFADLMAGPSFKTWSVIETGQRAAAGRIPEAVWNRVRAFVAEHGPTPDPAGTKGSV